MPHTKTAAFESPLVVASNRGPVSFHRNEEGELVGVRGSGGLVTALATAARSGRNPLPIPNAIAPQIANTFSPFQHRQQQ